MKTILLLVFLSLRLAASATEAPTKLVLTDGTTYQSVKVTRVDPDGLRIIHSSGVAKVPFEKLSGETRKLYHFDTEKAAAFRRSQAASAANAETAAGAKAAPVRQKDADSPAHPVVVPKAPAETLDRDQEAAWKEMASALADLEVFHKKDGEILPMDSAEFLKSLRKAAEQGNAIAQSLLGSFYICGAEGATKDFAEGATWARKAAEQGNAAGQTLLAMCYGEGDGVPKDEVECYKWLLLAVGQGDGPGKDVFKKLCKDGIAKAEDQLTREQIAEGQKLARNFKPRKVPDVGAPIPGNGAADSGPKSSGTGFFITEDGFLITNKHVVEGANQVRLASSAGLIFAKVVKVDDANDLALLKADGKFMAMPVAMSRAVKLGGSVATVGFPNIGMQGLSPKLAKGEIASLSGAADDSRYFQISVPVQPGNSGGALVDEHGNVVGVVCAKLNAAMALGTSGALPENVNYAVKSSYLLSFLESVPKVSDNLKEPNTKEKKFEDVVKSAEQSAVLVLVY